MPSFDLAGRAAIVTGAGSGLGRQFALTLARAGARVALAGRKIAPLTALAEEIEGFDGRAVPVVLDVSRPESVKQAVAAAETELGPIAILVNNAGVTVSKPVLEQSEADWDLGAGYQSQGRLADGPGNGAAYGAPRPWRQHRQHRLRPRPEGGEAGDRLCRLQGGAGASDPGAGAGAGALPDPRQCDLPRVFPQRDDGGVSRRDRRARG